MAYSHDEWEIEKRFKGMEGPFYAYSVGDFETDKSKPEYAAIVDRGIRYQNAFSMVYREVNIICTIPLATNNRLIFHGKADQLNDAMALILGGNDAGCTR